LSVEERRRGLKDLTPYGHRAQALSLVSDLVGGILSGKKPAWSIVLQGDNGPGKSVLAKAAVVEVCRAGGRGYCVSEIHLMDELRDANSPDSDVGVTQVRARYGRADLLVLDDLCTVPWKEFVSASLFELLDTRECLLRPTIITTNRSSDYIERHYRELGRSIVSRMVGACRRHPRGIFTWLQVGGPDLRMLPR